MSDKLVAATKSASSKPRALVRRSPETAQRFHHSWHSDLAPRLTFSDSRLATNGVAIPF
jgi:hypothetical protein